MIRISCDDAEITHSLKCAFATPLFNDMHILVNDRAIQCYISDILIHEAQTPIYMYHFKKACVQKCDTLSNTQIIAHGDFVLNYGTNQLLHQQHIINLTDKEAALIKGLFQHQTLAKERLIDMMWQQKYVDSGAFDTHLYRLRQKTDAYFEIQCHNNIYQIVSK